MEKNQKKSKIVFKIYNFLMMNSFKVVANI